MSWDDVGYVMASKNRRIVLSLLEEPKTPTILAKAADINLANVSRTLTELERNGLVVCLTPKKRVGRIYSLTKKGKEVVGKVAKMERRE
ncbi:MAG TPA: helix-turn-helix domain-containing protein [Nitrososphaera sp.]